MILCITGMHRSGTSLTASWLQDAGLVIDNGVQIAPANGNPKGHFEDAEFVQLHEGVLRSRFPSSKGWIAFCETQHFEGTSLFRAKEMITQRNSKFCVWGWKDPRTVLFLEQWKELIPDLRVLLLWRPYRNVVDSLIRRSKRSSFDVLRISMMQASRLWISYNRHVLAYRQNHPKDSILVQLEAVLLKDQEVFEMITSRLEIPLSYSPIQELVDNSLITLRGPRSTQLWCRIMSDRGVEARLRNSSDLLA